MELEKVLLGNRSDETVKLNRKDFPHHATVTLKIDIRKMNKDGSLENKVLSASELSKYGMGIKAQICTSGATQSECIKNLKEMLEKMNG